MERDPAVYFLNQLRQARAAVLRDGEAVDALVHVFERMGTFLNPNVMGLYNYKRDIRDHVATHTPLAREVPERCEELIPFEELYDSMRVARNSAVHEGAYARHFASHAVKLALILEDGLMNELKLIRDLMVPNPLCVEAWHPLGFIRQMMLENSFSFMPFRRLPEGQRAWSLVSDLEMVRYLRSGQNRKDRVSLLAQPLKEAVKPGGFKLQTPRQVNPGDSIFKVLEHQGDSSEKWDGLPILVVHPVTGDLIGILTAFDLL